jgi:hypothetical protein
MLPVCFFHTCYSQKQQFVFSTIVQKVRVFIALFIVEKVPLNCTHLSTVSTIVQKVSVYCIFHTRRTGLNCCLSLFFSIAEKMLYPTRAKSVLALDVLSHSPAALVTIFSSRAIIIHFLHLLHK